MPTGPTGSNSSDTTDLERRVLAHERVLQAVIAYLARTEPQFLDHLRDTFVDPMSMGRPEHDYRGVDDYAEEFIRAVMLLPETRAAAATNPPSAPGEAGRPRPAPAPRKDASCVEVHERNGIWSVSVDGVFDGDYVKKADALAAAALLKLARPSAGLMAAIVAVAVGKRDGAAVHSPRSGPRDGPGLTVVRSFGQSD